MFRTTEQIENEVFDIAEQPVGEVGGYVLDVRLKGARGTRRIIIIADTEQGITLDELSEISRKVEEALDQTDIFSEKYTLEVTSPGLDWPLTTERDFRRRRGEKIRLEHTMLEPEHPIEGVVDSVTDEKVYITNEEQGELAVPYDQIVEGKVVLDW